MDNSLGDLKSVKGFKVHADRGSALRELHARPHLNLESPCTLFHFAFLCSSAVGQQLIANLAGEEINPRLRHAAGNVGGFDIKFERHTEFVSCTLKGDTTKTTDEAFAALAQLVPGDDVEFLVALKVDIHGGAARAFKKLQPGERIYGGALSGGNEVRTTLSQTEDGVLTFSVRAPKQTGDELGRRVQRLIEFETYRTLCLVGLPCARRTSVAVTAMDARLNAIINRIANAPGTSEEDVSKTFDELVDLSARADALRAETKFRFSASRAYYALVQQRMETLNEAKVGDMQRFTRFVMSRLNPAIATIESVSTRQAVLSDDLGRALALLRTRIELNMNRANQGALQSMNKRHLQQLLISQTVEGLSIIAITYYSMGLLGYVFKAAAKAHILPVPIEVATALSIPLVFLAAFVSLRRLRKHWAQ